MKSIFVAAVLTASAMAFAGCAATTPNATAPNATAPKVVRKGKMPKRIQGKISLASVQDTQMMMLDRAQEVLLKVRLCVAPDGSVSDAKLVAPSGYDGYDKAVVDSIKAWRYQPYKAAKNMRMCKTVRVQYNAG